MNTQTHLLLAAGAFARPGRPWRNAAALIGATLPDASIFALFGWSKLAGVPDRKVWSSLYWSDGWQTAGAVSNSFPLWGALAGLAALLAWKTAGRTKIAAGLLLVLALAGLLHLAFDIPVHADDAHRHFWPFSDWRFHSPISYWDPGHFGRWVSAAEAVLGLGVVVLLWRRFSGLIARGLLILAALSYAAVPLYWLSAFG